MMKVVAMLVPQPQDSITQLSLLQEDKDRKTIVVGEQG
jgi:hypothetical protein